MIKAIFWDSDGTLVDTEKIFFKAYKIALKNAGVELTRDFYIHKQLKENISILELARERGLSEEEIANIQFEGYELYKEFLLKNVPVLNGVTETLEELFGKFTMGIVTSSKKTHFEIIMKSTKLAGYFDFFITREDVNNVKPDPESYILALKKTGLKPEECLVIEDSERGVLAAKRAGIQCYAVPNELTKYNNFSEADRILGRIEELVDLLSLKS